MPTQFNEPAWKELASAFRRARKMGVHHAWEPSFDSHALAPCIKNHMDCIEVEFRETNPDYVAILEWQLNMARRINRFCDEHMVKDDRGAQYWMEVYMYSVDSVVFMEAVA